ncbi:hypothetical protein JMJ58_19215 [Haloterrigena salifodinae]|uniref:Uncharacterized protein n=1 Tax=Haloterrigena salifodinae TaxID=2675099 RepID=A0A8T8E0H0_9EURY|nr:hypothetical protein [Haloterrigena salifodinae]QRV15013.1 hypothetical protein JMJ58_19215 [Haloterrigena salifodinae]
MSDGELKVSDGVQSEAVHDLIRALPPFYAKDETSGNFQLLDVVGKGIDRLDFDIERVDKAMTLQEAEKAASIDRIADVVGVSRRTGESIEKYRMRTLLAFQSLTAEGTIPDMFISFASILRGDESEFWYQDWEALYDEDSTFAFLVPIDRVEDSVLEPTDIPEIAAMLAPAAKTVEVQYNGSLRPVSAADYEAGNYDAEGGFGTLDENGDPAPSGGTFGGLIQ